MPDQRDNQQQNHVSEDSFPIAKEARVKHEETVRRVPVPQQLVVTLGILVLIFGATYVPTIMRSLKQHEESPPDYSTESSKLTTAEDPFADIKVEGRAAYVWDVKNQRALYNRNADEQLPLASVTKLMTALVAYELLGDRTDVAVTMDAILQEGDSGLLNEEMFTSRDLSDLTLLTSSNDGAYALAAAGERVLNEEVATYTFIDVMNMRADELGLSQTYFQNPTGLDVSSEESGAYGSARDMAYLMEYLITKHPDVLEFTRKDELLIPNKIGDTHEAENTNSIVSRVPGIIGSKTGYTTLAGGNLVVAFNAGLNHPIIISVLGSSSAGRFLDTLKLTKAAQASLLRDQ